MARARRGRNRGRIGSALVSWVALIMAAPELAAAPEILDEHAARGSQQAATSTSGVPELDVAARLLEEAKALRKAGKYDEALRVIEQALAIIERERGPDDIAVANALHVTGLILDDKHEYSRAEPLTRRALAIRERVLGPDHPDVALSLANLAWLVKVRQDFAGAEALYRRALDIQERALGPNHADVAPTLNDLAILYNQTGRYDDAGAMYQRVIAIREASRNDDGLALALNNLGRVFLNKGDYERAAETLRRSLSVWERAWGPDHPRVANALDGLGNALASSGDYVTAEPLYVRALAIREKTLGPDHPEVGTTLNNLGVLYYDMGDFDRAVQLLQREVAITEARHGPEHSHLGPPLSNLARIDQQQGRYAQADARYRRTLAIRERAFGSDHPTVGSTLNRLGHLYLEDPSKDPAEAEAFLRRALTTLEKAVGLNHPDVASVLTGLATVADRKGEAAESERLLRRALVVQEQVLGRSHPQVATSLERLATLRQSQKDGPGAVAYLQRAYDIRERHLERNLPLGSDRQRVGYLTLFANDTDQAISLHTHHAPDSPDALDLAVTTVLRRKGRALDATTDSVAIMRRHAPDQQRVLFDRLTTARAQLATVTLRGPGGTNPTAFRATLERLEETVDRVENELSAASAAFRAELVSITRAAVQRAVPPGAALVEYALYQPRDAATGPVPAPRYVAYVLAPGDGPPGWADLGEASAIDAAIDAWRRALRDPQRRDVKELARVVDGLVMQPARGLLGEVSHLLIAPDGPLNLIPFAALADEQGRYLIERWAMTYLTSGRDLLRRHEPRRSQSNPVVIAAPAFGAPAAVAAGEAQASGRVRVDTSKVFFGPLPGVGDEVRALRRLLPEASFLIGPDATESALRGLTGPRVLHVATHGFFLDGEADVAGTAPVPAGTRLGRWAATVQNPLLRSGLALVGANQGSTSGDDGILTALEASSLDLWGTQLVVLSACDTGVGEVRNGHGVYGLRRAFVLAGAESQLMSLWPVSDRSTRELMVSFYRQITGDTGRADAVRRAQRDLMNTPRYVHPYYWASFILSGAWSPMGQQADERRTK